MRVGRVEMWAAQRQASKRRQRWTHTFWKPCPQGKPWLKLKEREITPYTSFLTSPQTESQSPNKSLLECQTVRLSDSDARRWALNRAPPSESLLYILSTIARFHHGHSFKHTHVYIYGLAFRKFGMILISLVPFISHLQKRSFSVFSRLETSFLEV